MRVASFLALFLLLSCSRPLTPSEIAFAQDIQGDTINISKVRMTRDVPLGVATFQIEKRPRLTCRERLFPERDAKTVTVSPAAVVLWNRVLFSKDWYTADYLKDYPQQIDLVAAMLFAHEITHVWQWQNRDLTGYSPWGAAREHQNGSDPYLFDIETQTSFLDYGYEQQASIVEEYLCCALLDPDAPRTHRMKGLLDEVFPLQSLPQPNEVLLPWDGVELEGICQ
ncbi:MAG: hypothetical protein ABJQ23_16080 [Shimia thalassica]|uniref:hypothetical protein n=2 Tax=Shimia thalassica TaxID=1715693 RepID=UPI003298BDE3